METITHKEILPFVLGAILLLAVGIQIYFGKVYTRGRANLKWHEKKVISSKEARYRFWIILGLQFVIGLFFVLPLGIEIFKILF